MMVWLPERLVGMGSSILVPGSGCLLDIFGYLRIEDIIGSRAVGEKVTAAKEGADEKTSAQGKDGRRSAVEKAAADGLRTAGEKASADGWIGLRTAGEKVTADGEDGWNESRAAGRRRLPEKLTDGVGLRPADEKATADGEDGEMDRGQRA